MFNTSVFAESKIMISKKKKIIKSKYDIYIYKTQVIFFRNKNHSLINFNRFRISFSDFFLGGHSVTAMIRVPTFEKLPYYLLLSVGQVIPHHSLHLDRDRLPTVRFQKYRTLLLLYSNTYSRVIVLLFSPWYIVNVHLYMYI